MQYFLIFSYIIFSLTSYADDKSDIEQEERSVIYKQRTEIDFEGIEIQGILVKPQGSLILDRRSASFNPLIKLRTDFDDEIEKSVDEIK